jgi:hypothetical protein
MWVVADHAKAFGLGHLQSAVVVERCAAPNGGGINEYGAYG